MSIPKRKILVNHPDDHFFKIVMQQVKNVRAYLQEFHPKFVEFIDLDTLENTNTSFITADLKDFKADIIYKCKFKDTDRTLSLSLLWEHKSIPDEFTSLQLATYISQALYQQFRNGNKPIEPIIAIVFYNGKKSWKPKTVSELFEDHPYYEFFASYLPTFKFEFLDIAHFPKDRLIAIQRGFLKSALLAMANRFKPDLLIQFLYIIFEVEGERDFQAIVQYYLAVLDRSPKQFRDELKNIEFANKPRLMSTLEMLINEGLEEGIEKGLKKGLEKGLKQGLEEGLEKGLKQGLKKGLEKGLEKGLKQGREQGLERGLEQGLLQGEVNAIISNLELLVKTNQKFLDLSYQDIADISALELEQIQAFFQILKEYASEKMAAIQALQAQFFKDLPINETQLGRLHQLVESY